MDSIDIVLFSSFGFLFILGTFGNLCILAAMAKLKPHRRPTHTLMTNQAISDLGLVAISLPLRIARMSVKKSLVESSLISSDMYCRITAGVNVMFLGASCYGVFLMTMDKFLAVRFPLSYRTGIHKGHFIIPIILTWLVPAVVGSCGTFVPSIQEDLDDHEHDIGCLYGSVFREGYALFVYTLALIIPLLMIFPIYIYILKKVKSSWKFVIPNPSDNCVADTLPGLASSRRVKDVNTFRKKEIKLAKGIFLVLGIHLMCLTPIVVLDFLHIILHWAGLHVAVEVSLAILYLNAVLDPPIYARHSTEIKQTIKRLLLHCVGRGRTRNTLNSRLRKRDAMRVPIANHSNPTFAHSIIESGEITNKDKRLVKETSLGAAQPNQSEKNDRSISERTIQIL